MDCPVGRDNFFRLHSTLSRLDMSRVLIRQFHASRRQQFEMLTVLQPIHDGLQFAHTSMGMQWHTVIPLTAVALRTAITLPFSISNRLRSRKQAQLQPLLGAATPIMRAKLARSEAAQNGSLTMDQIDILVNKERRRRRVELFKKYKCQVWKSVAILPAVQIPLWISVSMVIRSMCGWTPVEGVAVEQGFKTDSFLWYNDLMVIDPYGILPMAIGAVSMANMEWNAHNINSTGTRSKNELTIPGILTTASRIGAIFIMTIAFQAPTALCLYWFSSNAFSLAQNMLLDVFLPVRYTPPKDSIDSSTTEIVHSTETIKQ